MLYTARIIDKLLEDSDSVATARNRLVVIEKLEELKQLKEDAYFMRYVLHELGVMRDWTNESTKARMENILYDPETGKLRE
jgi:hypothetical protein